MAAEKIPGNNITFNSLGQEMYAIFDGWDELEEKIGSGVQLIDLRMVPPLRYHYGKFNFQNRNDVVEHLVEMTGSVASETMEGEFVLSRVDSALAYMAALEGREVSLEEYQRRTNGITKLDPFSEGELSEIFDVVDTHFRELGYDKFDVKQWDRFQRERQKSPLELIRGFKQTQRRIGPIVKEVVGNNFNLDGRSYKTEVVNMPKPWINSLTGGPDKYAYKVNIFPKNSFRLFPGMDEFLPIHEVGGHLGQALRWRGGIRDERISDVYDFTTIPGPEQVINEGLADSLPFLLPVIWDEVLSPEGKFATIHTALRNMVLGNVHLMAQDREGGNLLDIYEFVATWLPSEPSWRIPVLIHERGEDPRYRSYGYTYTHGDKFFRDARKSLSQDKVFELVRFCYEQPVTLKQAQEFVGSFTGQDTT